MTLCAKVCLPLAGALLLAGTAPAATQHRASLGRFSLFYDLDRRQETGAPSTDFSLLTAYIALRSPASDEDGVEYAVDARTTMYPSSDRGARASVYDAYVGDTLLDGRLGVRLGQMWLNDLGALGSVGGVDVEYRHRTQAATLWRAGLFGGLEPKSFDTGYAPGIRKAGVYGVYEGHAARRHVLGFVALRNEGVKERSVLSTTNFIPVGGKLYIYQIAEYDLHGPGGTGNGGLNYVFAMARVLPSPVVEIQLDYHHGRSVDARSITNDQIAGRPVNPRLLEGYLFDSAGGRLTFNISRGVRVYAGYAQERSNQSDKSFPRVTGGASFNNIAGSGVDVTAYASRIDRESGPYSSYYASVGRSLSSRYYLSLDFTSSLSVFRVDSGGGVIIENRPQARRLALSGTANLGRWLSLFLTLERLDDDAGNEARVATGLSVRF
jgi:hypothetical protein